MDLGSPQALMSSAGCAWIAEKERRLEGEKDERVSLCPLPIRIFRSESAPQNCGVLPYRDQFLTA
ncbi:MAG: hypothetical protein ACPLIG_04665 [Candidatus Bathyarchaeales archaeon]